MDSGRQNQLVVLRHPQAVHASVVINHQFALRTQQFSAEHGARPRLKGWRGIVGYAGLIIAACRGIHSLMIMVIITNVNSNFSELNLKRKFSTRLFIPGNPWY